MSQCTIYLHHRKFETLQSREHLIGIDRQVVEVDFLSVNRQQFHAL
jgi:hypothetical protein